MSVPMECRLQPNGGAKSKFIQLKRERKENQQHKSKGGHSAHEAYISPSKVEAFANRLVCVWGGEGGGGEWKKKKKISHNKAELL